jgi:hypothetical protein
MSSGRTTATDRLDENNRMMEQYLGAKRHLPRREAMRTMRRHFL